MIGKKQKVKWFCQIPQYRKTMLVFPQMQSWLKRFLISPIKLLKKKVLNKDNPIKELAEICFEETREE
jgi:hypothetical protein